MKHILRRITFLFLLVLAAISTHGQDRGFDPFTASSASGTSPAKNRIESVQFVDAPITDVFTMISDLTGWSIVMSAEVSAKPPRINLWIKNLTPDQVLEHVVNLANLVQQREGNLIKILTFNEYARLYGLEKKVIPLKYAQAKEMADILKPYADKEEQAMIVPDHGGNKIVLLVPRPLMESMENLVAMLDAPFEKDEITLIPLQHLEATEIVPALEDFLVESSRRTGSRSQGRESEVPTAEGVELTRAGESWLVQFMVEPKLNVIVLRGHPQDVEQTVDLIRKLDVPTALETTGYELQFTNVRDAFNTLQEIVRKDQERIGRNRSYTGPPRLRIASSEQNNRIIVEGSADDQARISKIIEAIDKPLPNGSGGIRVYRLENTSSSEVIKVIENIIAAREKTARQLNQGGPSSEASPPSPSGQGATPAGPPGADATPPQSTAGDILPAIVTEAPEINAVIIKASAVEHEEFAEVIRELDTPREQVVLEVTLVAVRNSNGFELGIELGGSGTGVGDAKTETIGFTHYGIGNVDPATGSIRLPDPALFGLNWAIFNSGDFSFILNAIKSVGETRITSSPKILIEDNALARLSQLSQEPYETSSQGETSTITSFGGFVDAGTVLNIIPHVSDQDWLRLEYQIQFSSFSARTAQQLAANLPPPRQENNINGTVRVPAEHTVVLGGLVSTRNDKTIEGIPWISDIPILGELFTNRSNDKQDETLFIFISPVVLRDPEFQDLLSLSHEDMKKAQLYQQRELTNPLKMFDPDFDMRQGEIQ